MVDFSLGPWPLGLDNLSPGTGMPSGTLRQAHNVYVLKSGEIEARPGKRRLFSGSGLHSLWTSRELGRSFCVKDGVLQRVQVVAGNPVFTAIGAVSGGALTYCDLNGAVVLSNGSGLWRTDGASLWPLTLPNAVLTVSAATGGGLDAGRYAVAVAFMRGDEEGPLSAVQMVNVQADGKLMVQVSWLTGAGVTGARVYRSPWNGDVLYLAGTIPFGMSDYALGAGELGRTVQLHTSPLPGGAMIRHFRGRLLVARGKAVLWSEPMRYGVTDARVNFVQFGSDVRVLEPLEGANAGVYVGTGEGVFFAAGDKPLEWRLARRGAGIPVAGSGRMVPANDFDGGSAGSMGGEIASMDALLPVWWSDQGLAIGLPSGQVMEPHAGQVKLPVPDFGVLGWCDRRLFFGG